MTAECRRPRQTELPPAEIEARIALVRAAKASCAGNLPLDRLDELLPAVDPIRPREVLPGGPSYAAQARYRKRNREQIREYDRTRGRERRRRLREAAPPESS